jgi:hypothetical protein
VAIEGPLPLFSRDTVPRGILGGQDPNGITIRWGISLGAEVSIPGDFNLDGVVDGDDLTIWEAAFGTDGGADADKDGDSDGADFLLWQRNFGKSVNTVAANVVPEPTHSVLVLLGVIGYLSTRLSVR